jgi:hypothetical protein
MRFVAVKDEAQQANGVVFRARDLLVRQRPQCINALRGHLMEYGYVAAKGPTHVSMLIDDVEDQNDLKPNIGRVMRLIALWQHLRQNLLWVPLQFHRYLQALDHDRYGSSNAGRQHPQPAHTLTETHLRKTRIGRRERNAVAKRRGLSNRGVFGRSVVLTEVAAVARVALIGFPPSTPRHAISESQSDQRRVDSTCMISFHSSHHRPTCSDGGQPSLLPARAQTTKP